MKLPIGIAKKLLQMLEAEKLPSSSLRHSIVDKMVDDGVIQKVQLARSKATYGISNKNQFHVYIQNNFAIADLERYILSYRGGELTRAEAIEVAGDSKIRSIRTFTGFPVNSYSPVSVKLNGQELVLQPADGTSLFIHNYTGFFPDPAISVVGIENPENFLQIRRQQHLFCNMTPLFVCRYPQSGDLVKWLRTIPNKYLHFGDFDLQGINIYLNEYKKYLGYKARFFIPSHIQELMQQFGNRDLYDRQLSLAPNPDLIAEPELLDLLKLIHKYKKGLEQEVLIKAK